MEMARTGVHNMRLIDADALMSKFAESMPEYLSGTHAQRESIKLINEAPTVEPVNRGKWIWCRFHERFLNSYEEQCSICESWSLEQGNFCANCGANMKQEAQHE